MSRVRRDIEAMADLLLGSAPVPQPDRVTVLLDGNLPSRGDGWRAAAADLVAGRGTGTYMQARFGELQAVQLGGQASGNTLSSLFESAPPGHRWVVSAGSDVQGSTLAGVDEVTLITGVDEAAIVAAYTLLKQLLIDRPGRMPRVSLVLAGTNTMAAGDRFVQTARARLGVEPTVLGCLPQADGAHRRWTPMAMPDGGIGAVVSMLVAAAGSRSTATGERPTVEDSPSSVQPRGTVSSHSDDPPRACEDLGSTPVAASAPSDPIAPEATAAVGEGPRPLPQGLQALAVVCPWATGVVFATDGQGMLHAVAPASLLADLVAAIGWAAQHASMLPGNGVVQGHILVGDVHWAAVLRDGPWPVHVVIEGPQGPLVLPAQGRSLSAGPSAGTVPGWPPTKA